MENHVKIDNHLINEYIEISLLMDIQNIRIEDPLNMEVVIQLYKAVKRNRK